MGNDVDVVIRIAFDLEIEAPIAIHASLPKAFSPFVLLDVQ
jgi:hypothetical protein